MPNQSERADQIKGSRVNQTVIRENAERSSYHLTLQFSGSPSTFIDFASAVKSVMVSFRLSVPLMASTMDFVEWSTAITNGVQNNVFLNEA